MYHILYIFITAGNEVGTKVIFLEACVRNWFCSQGGSAPLHAGIKPPPTRGSHHPGADTHPPGTDTSPGNRETGATSRRYPFYWNAILFTIWIVYNSKYGLVGSSLFPYQGLTSARAWCTKPVSVSMYHILILKTFCAIQWFTPPDIVSLEIPCDLNLVML